MNPRLYGQIRLDITAAHSSCGHCHFPVFPNTPKQWDATPVLCESGAPSYPSMCVMYYVDGSKI
jgi:hypothetical protein